MAGVTAAWELSRPGWHDRFESVVLYQRGWLLGGKGASTRGADARILEHGLHVWLGYYDNAFRVLREAYAELDRTRTDPDCPIRTWREAFCPSPEVGVFEHNGDRTSRWVARFGTNELVPGEPSTDPDVAALVRRGAGLAADLLRSSRGRPGVRIDTAVDLVTTVLRGSSADGLLRPGGGGLSSVDHLDFREWLRSHGAAAATIDGGLVRGMYDLVFAYEEGDRDRPAFPAGLGVFLAMRMFLDYKGAIFWKMTAGMGDIVFAPLHQALLQRGVEIRYFHRVDALRLTDDGTSLAAVELTRQAPDGVIDEYEPLERIGGLPCFPSQPRVDGLGDFASTEAQPLPGEGEHVRLTVGEDVDDVVLAVSIGALPEVAADVVIAHPRWQAMISHVRTVATRSAQLWLRDDEAELGWPEEGATLSGLEAPLDTCASMTHLLATEEWPEERRPGALAYLCSALPDRGTGADLAGTVDSFLHEWSSALWPGGGPTSLADDRIVAHHLQVNVDPSDRYVQSAPGSGQHRLRADGSGVDHLFLAGDWIDCGLNAGCIEAAAISGIQAAAAVEGRPLDSRVLGPLTWDLS